VNPTPFVLDPVRAAGISWPGEFHRHDIGWRAIERERMREGVAS
jgi:hypothetical protein